MKLEINFKKPRILASDIKDGQVFFAESVGSANAGVFIKLGDRGIWPIENGVLAPKGSNYNSPSCPVVGFEPITFVLKGI